MNRTKQFLSAIVLTVVFIATQPIAQAADAVEGKKIFSYLCSHCHMSDAYEDKFGPGLKGITDRVDEEWLDHWLKNPREMIETDEYAKSLHDSNAYGMSMPEFPVMQDDEKRANVIEYLKTL